MRKAFRDATETVLDENENLVLLLGDIGVHAFNEAAKRHPSRVMNFGIMEQTMVGFAAGLAATGFIPVLHSIAPFLVERALEQIKIDFGYQNLPGNLVSVGASYDYAALGGTHHSPGDVATLLAIPGVEIFTPGHPKEVHNLVRRHYLNDKLTYFRLSESTNSQSWIENDDKVRVIQKGSLGTVLAFGPMLDSALAATSGLDVSLIYSNSISNEAFCDAVYSTETRLFVVEPFYEATTAPLLFNSGKSFSSCHFAGYPKAFSHRYGSLGEHLLEAGLDPSNLRERIVGFLNE